MRTGSEHNGDTGKLRNVGRRTGIVFLAVVLAVLLLISIGSLAVVIGILYIFGGFSNEAEIEDIKNERREVASAFAGALEEHGGDLHRMLTEANDMRSLQVVHIAPGLEEVWLYAEGYSRGFFSGMVPNMCFVLTDVDVGPAYSYEMTETNASQCPRESLLYLVYQTARTSEFAHVVLDGSLQAIDRSLSAGIEVRGLQQDGGGYTLTLDVSTPSPVKDVSCVRLEFALTDLEDPLILLDMQFCNSG